MTNDTRSPTPDDLQLAAFIEELLGVGGMIARLLDHMDAFQAAGLSDPDGPPAHVILEGLFTDILRPVVRNRRRSDVKAAVGLLSDAAEALCEEILVVPVEEMERMRDEG